MAKKKSPPAEPINRPVGRPMIIQTPEEMDRRVDAYVAQCAAENQPITLTGMILSIGLMSRQSLDRYQENPEFSDSVKRAKLIVEHEYEKRLAGSNATGSIFALKNFGWKDAFEAKTTNLNMEATPENIDEHLDALNRALERAVSNASG